MKPPARKESGNTATRLCRTPDCGVSHSHGQSAANPRSQPGAARPVGPSGARANYRVQAPVPLGQGNQQIRATIQGSPQVAGSVEISRSAAGTAFISNLRVEQQHRRRGVAAQLIDAAVNTARRQGFKSASLEARPSDNGISPQALVAMYRRQGFKSVGRSSRGSPLMERKLK
jgi:ribosomal protein S18 acetylase RimI-like enzyme